MAAEELGLKGEGAERREIKELDEAMATLLNHRAKRMKHGKEEKEAGAIVVSLFKKHRLKAYNFDDKTFDLKAVEKVILHKEESEDEE